MLGKCPNQRKIKSLRFEELALEFEEPSAIKLRKSPRIQGDKGNKDKHSGDVRGKVKLGDSACFTFQEGRTKER